MNPLLTCLKKDNFKIDDRAKNSIEQIKIAIMNADALLLPNWNEDFILYTDASDWAIGAVLMQEHEGEEKPIFYGSRRMLDRERNYSVTEKECLSIIWAIEKYKIYLLHREFIIKTDHKALIWLLKLKEPRNRLARLVMKIQQYKFKIVYIPGPLNILADSISREVVSILNKVNSGLKSILMRPDECSNLDMCKNEIIKRAHEDSGHSCSEVTYLMLKNENTWKGNLKEI